MSASTCSDPAQTQWMLAANSTPCQIAESIVQVCTPTAAVQHLSVDVSCSALGTSTASPCCCSTVTYALVAACFVCQTSQTQLSSTYRSWLAGCSSPLTGSLPPVVTSASPSIPIPSWALVQPTDTNSPWNISLAQRAAGVVPTDASPSPSPSSTSPPPQKRSAPPYGPIAIITSLVITFLLLGMGLWLYRRRNRVAPSRASPDFEIDGTDQHLIPQGQDQDTPKGWAWWTRKLKGQGSGQGPRTSVSDPGKIDAWRYPFEYTPVNLTDSSGGSSRGYHDPYNPGRTVSSDGRRGARVSVDSLAVRGQASSGTLYQGVSSTSLLPGQGYATTSGPGFATTSGPGFNTSASGPGYTSSAPPPGLGYPTTPHYTTPSPGYVTPTPNSSAQPQFSTSHPYPPYTIPGYTHQTQTTTTYQPPAPQGHITPYPYPHPSNGPRTQPATSPLSPHSGRPHAHTHSHTFELKLSPEQYAELRSMYPEIRVRTRRKRRRREREEASGSSGAGAGPTRPRSWSVPPPQAQALLVPEVQVEDDRDGRPRNGVELREKYSRGRRRRRGAESDTEGVGVTWKDEVDARGSSAVERESRGNSAIGRESSGGGGGGGGGGRRNSYVNQQRSSGGEWEIPRALDGGVSLMGGPPRR